MAAEYRMTPDDVKLERALGSSDLAWLVKRIRRRYEYGRFDAKAPLILKHPSPRQREACDRLLGRKPTRGDSLAVRLDQLEQVIIQGEIAPSLRDAIEALTGPLIDHSARRQRIQAVWQALFDRFHPAACGNDVVMQWYQELWETGVLRRLARNDPDQAAALLKQAMRVVERLPVDGVTLARLAAECCGDSHALDAGQPVGTLAVRAAAKIGDVKLKRTAAGRRRAWGAVGVICDELSAPVLALNLPTTGDSLTDKLLRLCAARGEPCRVTSRQLLRHTPRFDATSLDGEVFVCENASVVVAAADDLGVLGRPLVCIDGQPTTAAQLMLRALTNSGIKLRYHGDFDWGGLRIANRVHMDHHAQPWRMSTDDYLAAASQGGRELKGDPVTATWDACLSSAMVQRRIAIHEERVLALLLDDLRPSRA